VDSEPLYKLQAEFFKTLGHPARIRVLELPYTGLARPPLAASEATHVAR
jgi:hypothetical protein